LLEERQLLSGFGPFLAGVPGPQAVYANGLPAPSFGGAGDHPLGAQIALLPGSGGVTPRFWDSPSPFAYSNPSGPLGPFSGYWGDRGGGAAQIHAYDAGSAITIAVFQPRDQWLGGSSVEGNHLLAIIQRPLLPSGAEFTDFGAPRISALSAFVGAAFVPWSSYGPTFSPDHSGRVDPSAVDASADPPHTPDAKASMSMVVETTTSAHMTSAPPVLSVINLAGMLKSATATTSTSTAASDSADSAQRSVAHAAAIRATAPAVVPDGLTKAAFPLAVTAVPESQPLPARGAHEASAAASEASQRVAPGEAFASGEIAAAAPLPEADAASIEVVSPLARGAGMLAGFTPFDRGTLEHALDQFLDHLGGFESDLPDLGSPVGITPHVVTAAVALGVAEVVRRRMRGTREDEDARVPGARDPAFPGLPGLWNRWALED
jgi:hypothetical protein